MDEQLHRTEQVAQSESAATSSGLDSQPGAALVPATRTAANTSPKVQTGVVVRRADDITTKPMPIKGLAGRVKSGRAAQIFAIIGVAIALAAVGTYVFTRADAKPKLSPEETVKEFLSAVFLADDPTRVGAVTCSNWDPVDAIARTSKEIEKDVHVSWDQIVIVTNSEERASATARLGQRRPDDRQPSTFTQWRFSLVNEDGWRVCEARPVT